MLGSGVVLMLALLCALAAACLPGLLEGCCYVLVSSVAIGLAQRA